MRKTSFLVIDELIDVKMDIIASCLGKLTLFLIKRMGDPEIT